MDLRGADVMWEALVRPRAIDFVFSIGELGDKRAGRHPRIYGRIFYGRERLSASLQ